MVSYLDFLLYRDCFDICTQNELISVCSCHLPFFSNLNKSSTPCTTPQLMICAFTSYFAFRLKVSSECEEFCPLECQNIEYSLYPSSSDYSGQNILDNVQMKYPNLTIQELKSRLVAVKVFYPELKYTSISQVFTTSIWDMVTSIGGAFGLFVGGSLLSILEIFYGTIDVLGNIIKKTVIRHQKL